MKQSLQVSYSAGKLSSESCACLAWASSCAWVTTAGNLQITSDCYSKVLHEISIQVSTKSAHDTVATTSPLHYGYPASNPESLLSIAPSAAGELPALAPRHVQPHGSSLHPWSMVGGFVAEGLPHVTSIWDQHVGKRWKRTLKRTLIPYRPYRGNPSID